MPRKTGAQYLADNGVNAVAVTAGYIDPAPRIEFFDHVDAANVASLVLGDRAQGGDKCSQASKTVHVDDEVR
ncbi:MAG: hypothetical protein IIA33_07425 [Planctomycetes bacterium]|nr:hypothetical protein [Planctomycetota bacterium]